MKKSLTAFLCITIVVQIVHAQNIGIGTNSPHASALLDVSSNSKGMLVPRMTSAQRTAIASPATGLSIGKSNAGTATNNQ